MTQLSPGQLKSELDQLANASILRRFHQGRHVYFQANMDCPIADELRSIVMKTMGAAAQIRQGSEFLSRQIRWAFIFGSLASQSEQSYSDVDLLVVGDVTFSDVVSSIRNVEQSIQRPINPNVYSESEFCNKLCEGHHFLTRVVSGEKLMLIGDEHDMSSLLAG